MDDIKDKYRACSMSQIDTQGQSNLCCCYVIDDSGDYQDPCFHPVDTCCCCHEAE